MPTNAQMRKVMLDLKKAMEQEQKAREAIEMAARISQLFGTSPKSCVKGKIAVKNIVNAK